MLVKEILIADIKVKDRYREDKGNIGELADSISTHGLIQPITVSKDLRLIAGERRLLAHKHLGLDKIHAVIRDVSSGIDLLEIELVENTQRKDLSWPERAKLEKKIYDMRRAKNPNWSQRDQEKLMGHSLGAVNRRLQLAEALDLLPDLAEHDTEDAAFKEYKKLEEKEAVKIMRAKAPPKDLSKSVSLLAEHYIIGSAFEGMAECPEGGFDFAEVDPPYGVDLDRRKGRNTDDSPMDNYNEWEGSEFLRLYGEVAVRVYSLLKPDSFAVFWYGMSWHCDILKILRKAGFKAPDIPAVWTKSGGGQTAQPDTTLGSCYEPFFLVRKGQPKLAKPGRGNVFAFNPLHPSKKIHPTEKPLDLMTEILETVLRPGASVLVPFLGSGVSLLAAYKLGHTGLGWDLSQDYKDGFIEKAKELKL